MRIILKPTRSLLHFIQRQTGKLALNYIKKTITLEFMFLISSSISCSNIRLYQNLMSINKLISKL